MGSVLRAAFSIAVALVVLIAIVSIAWPAASPAGGVFALLSLVFGLGLVRSGQRAVAVVLIAAGIVAFAAAVQLGHRVEPAELLVMNQDIVAMLASVSFLGFVARTVGEVRPRLHGRAAVVRTLGLAHVLAAVINLSAITVIGDHLRREDGLRDADVQIVTRGFATAGMWSPFWAGSAISLALLPTANVPVVIGVGLVTALLILAATTWTITRSLGPDLADYRGYALSWRLLRIPLALVAIVFSLHLLLPVVPVPRLIALGALAVTVGWALLAGWREFPRRMWAEITTTLPGTRGEATLFVAAGVMAIGLNALIDVLDLALPVASFTVPVAWGVVAAMAVGVLLGIHQVISIGLIAALVLPLQPEPTLFMSAILIGWGSSVAIGPLAGTQMYLQGRYGVNNLRTVRQNAPFFIVTLLLAWPALYAVSGLVQALG